MIPELKAETKALIMCSTKSRTARIMDMVNSFNSTKRGNTELVIYVSDDDPELSKYKELLVNEKYVVGKARYMVEVLNYLSTEAYPNIQYYAEVNDDHVYVTEGWDIKMMAALAAKQDWGIAYGITKNLPTATMTSNKLVKALGYFLPSIFQHGYVDNFIVQLSEKTDLLTYLPDVNIDHRHWSFLNEVNIDPTYAWVNDNLNTTAGTYDNWIRDNLDTEATKIIEARKKDISNA